MNYTDFDTEWKNVSVSYEVKISPDSVPSWRSDPGQFQPDPKLVRIRFFLEVGSGTTSTGSEISSDPVFSWRSDPGQLQPDPQPCTKNAAFSRAKFYESFFDYMFSWFITKYIICVRSSSSTTYMQY